MLAVTMCSASHRCPKYKTCARAIVHADCVYSHNYRDFYNGRDGCTFYIDIRREDDRQRARRKINGDAEEVGG